MCRHAGRFHTARGAVAALAVVTAVAFLWCHGLRDGAGWLGTAADAASPAGSVVQLLPAASSAVGPGAICTFATTSSKRLDGVLASQVAPATACIVPAAFAATPLPPLVGAPATVPAPDLHASLVRQAVLLRI